LSDLGIRERHPGFFSWDEARRVGVGVVAFGWEPVFGGAGIEFDEFREENRDLVRVQRCLLK